MPGVFSLVSFVLGFAIVAAAWFDVLVTALHPSVESPFSARFHRAVWYAVRHVSRVLPGGSCRSALSWTLPLSVGGLILTWMGVLFVGFALMYLPGMAAGSHAVAGGYVSNGGAFRSGGAPLSWGDAFYYSGVCLTSVGFGDIVPLRAPLRVLSIAQGLSSLIFIGVAVTYVLAVFPVLPDAVVLATSLNEETNGDVDAIPMVRRYLSADAAEPLAQRCRDLSDQLMRLSQAHTTHPVLFYAHPVHAERSFLRILIVAQRLVTLLRYGLRHADYPTLVQDPRIIGLEESLILVLRTLGHSLHLTLHPSDVGPDASARLRREYNILLTGLRDAGLRGDLLAQRQDLHAYIRFRLVTDPYIEAYGANSGYDDDELWGAHPPPRGTTAPIPIMEEDEGADAAG